MSGRKVVHERRLRPISGREHMAVFGAAAVVAAVFAWFGTQTNPFTAGADAVCAVAFAAMALAILLKNRARHAGPEGAEPEGAEPEDHEPARGGRGHSAPAGATGAPAAGTDRRESLWPWVGCLGFLVAWELFTYFAGFGGHRDSFPTLSSLYDDAARWHAVKACLFFAWLALGWGLFLR